MNLTKHGFELHGFFLEPKSAYLEALLCHSAAACIYGKKFLADFMLIFEKFRLFYDVETHF